KKAAKSVHEKYLDLLSSRREYLGFSYQHYKNDLKSNLAMIPGKLRTEEANCKGGSSGINQTYLRVAAEIQLKDRYVDKIFPYIRKAVNDSIRYAEEESGVEKKSKNLDHPKTLGSLPVEREGEPQLGPKDQNGSHGDEHGEEMERDNLISHGAKEIAVDAIADTSMGAIALARYAGIAGAVACVSSHLLLEGHIDPRALMGEIIGIVSFPLGLTMIMLATAVENQEKREAYYQYWGIRKAKNSLMTMDTKSKDISKEFCEHLKNVKEEAENKQRDEMAERGQEMKRQHDRRTQMAEDMKVIRKARPEDRDRLIEEHRKKWSDETSP
ncbi:MAG: hypothetical protein AB7O96_03495, partial [Pseudobdellovibrionaceae bacterium]